MDVIANSQDITTYFLLTLTADGLPATGLTITDIDLQYVRSGSAPSAKVDATALAATNSAHADNKAIEIDATDQKGLYRIDWPDAAFASGVREVILSVTHASCYTEHLRVNLTPVAVDVQQWKGSTAPAMTGDAAIAAAVADILNAGGSGPWTTATGFAMVEPDNAGIAAINARLPLAPASVSDIPTPAQNASIWGTSVVGNGRTRDYYLQGGTNRIKFDEPAAGQYTLYASDDTTPLKIGTYNSSAVNPVIEVDPA